MKSYLRTVRISPKKANLVADMVRNKDAVKAMDYLAFLPKKAARPLRQAIGSAVANATNNFKQDKDKLYIKSIIIGHGATYHRFRPVSRGRAHPIRKKTTHISIELGLRAPESKPLK